MFKDQIAYKKYEWFVSKFKTSTLVETGTFWGESTLIFSKFHNNVITCEIDDDNIKNSINRFKLNGFLIDNIFYTETHNLKVFKFVKNDKNIWLVEGSSQLVLESIFMGELKNKFKTPYTFFLDAHGDSKTNYWPIIDELKLISKFGLSDSRIIIHDFKVPGFDDWSYDTYNNQDLDYEYIKEFIFKINSNYLPFFPDKVGDSVHGVGILYVVPNSEISFNEYLKLNRGNPPLKINESSLDSEQIKNLKNNFYTFTKKNNIL
jgi:hypothetical protein